MAPENPNQTFQVPCSRCGRAITGTPRSIAALVERDAVCAYCRGPYDYPEPFASYAREKAALRERLLGAVPTTRPEPRSDALAALDLSHARRREDVPVQAELSVLLLEAWALALLLAWLFHDRVGSTPSSAAASAFGAMGLLFLLGRLHFALLGAGWSLAKGKGRWLVWLVFGCTAALVPLGGAFSLMNRWLWRRARPAFRWPVLAATSLLAGLALAVAQARHDPLDALRAHLPAEPTDPGYALEPGTWTGTAHVASELPMAQLLGEILDAANKGGVPMSLRVDRVEGDTWTGRVDAPKLHVTMPVQGVWRANGLVFAGRLEVGGVGGGEPEIYVASVDDGALEGRGVDGVLGFFLEPGDGAEDTGR